MRGFGTVYEMYAAPDGLDVDEVALLHEAELPHRPLSEPMAHIRFFPTGSRRPTSSAS